MGINTGWGGGGASSFSQLTGTLSNSQIPNTEIAVGKLNATGTPSASTFLRGDGAWQTPAGGGSSAELHVRTGNALKGSTNTNIVRFPTAVGTPSSKITHNDADVTTQGSIFTITETDVYKIDVQTAVNTSGVGLFLLRDTSVSNTLSPSRVISGETQPLVGGQCSFGTTVLLNAGDKIWVYTEAVVSDFSTYNVLHRISIAKVGLKGDTGPQGPQGEGAIPQSLIRCIGLSAKGSSNTLIMRIPAPTQTVGSGITVTDSASLGGYVSVSTNGIYQVDLALVNSSGGLDHTYIKVASALSNSVATGATDIRKVLQTPNGTQHTASFPVYLTTTDLLFITNSITPDNTYPAFNNLTVARIA